MSPFTARQPGGRRARVNERLFFIKRSLIERNNSLTGGVGVGSAGPRRAQETPRQQCCVYSLLKLYTRTCGQQAGPLLLSDLGAGRADRGSKRDSA